MTTFGLYSYAKYYHFYLKYSSLLWFSEVKYKVIYTDIPKIWFLVFASLIP